MQQLGQVIKSILLSEKEPFSKDHMLYESIYMISSKYQNFRDREQIVVTQLSNGGGEKMGVIIERWQEEELHDNAVALYLYCSYG